MPALHPDLRRQLEKAVVAARDVAEAGATAALARLTVSEKQAFPHLSPPERAMRIRLRAKARQLGDRRDAAGTQAISRLVRDVAYEQWHRMLFARFLAENRLLIHPELHVPVTLKECEELARDETKRTRVALDAWALAGRFASRMLPQIFRVDDPALEVMLAPEHRQELERLLESLPVEVFTSDDGLGWVYQFWQSAEKQRVNERAKAGEKITGETLPAVTQLFTEHYMVQFLLHNTIGAWWAGKRLSDGATERQSDEGMTEGDLRASVALPGYAFEYLRFVKENSTTEDTEDTEGKSRLSHSVPSVSSASSVVQSSWRPAAGIFPGWPRRAAELKVLDPCCGSGHFLVAALELLARIRIAEEGLDVQHAVGAVIRDNLFGLELDPRCTQIAAFNLALTAWRMAGRHFTLPELHIACSGFGPSATQDQWLKLATDTSAQWKRLTVHDREKVRFGLINLHHVFSNAPELGSLIDTGDTPTGLISADWDTLHPFLAAAMASETDDEEAHERAVTAHGMAKTAKLLAGEYTLVITNVPYLGRNGQSDLLKAWADAHEPEAKHDLATMFVSRGLNWLAAHGTLAFVMPQNWLFLTSYRKFRERLLTERTWNLIARLGPKGFQTPMWDLNVMLAEISADQAKKDHFMAGIDVMACRTPNEKAALLRGEVVHAGPVAPADSTASPRPDGEMKSEPLTPVSILRGGVELVLQVEQLKNPDARILLAVADSAQPLSEQASCIQGLATSDDPQFTICFWEIEGFSNGWEGLMGTVESTCSYSGRERLIHWENGTGRYWRHAQALKIEGRLGGWKSGTEARGRTGILVSQMNSMPVTIYTGEFYDHNASVIVPVEDVMLTAMWMLASSREFVKSVRVIDQSLKPSNNVFVRVSFAIAHWKKVGAEEYPDGLPEPQSNDPTQWLFHGHPAGTLAAGPADRSPVRIADTVGADRHPSLICRESNPAVVLQVAVARLAGCRWPAELDSDMRLDAACRAWVDKCRELERFADDDGVVPLVPIHKELPADARVRGLLEAALAQAGAKLTPALLADLREAAGSPGKSLEEWLKNDFFAQHCALFHQRPFVWHIWDGRRDGFAVLVHYHHLAAPNGQGRKLLEKITYTYLGDWIAQQSAAAKSGTPGADSRLNAANELKKKLEAILTGEPPYDIFVRWKPLHEQPIGWEPDINDGVRINIRPFVMAGVLRSRVNVKWTKDRGKEPKSLRPREQFPWFWGWDEKTQDFAGLEKGGPHGDGFTGERFNDLHYTNAFKRAARERLSHTTAEVTRTISRTKKA